MDTPRQLRRNRVLERTFCLDVSGWDIERPMITGSHELSSDTQGSQRTPTQWYERKKSNHQPVSIVQRTCEGDVLGRVGLGSGAVHEFDPERIEGLACDQMMFLWLWCRLSCDPIGNGRYPGPIFARTDESKCGPEASKNASDRYASAGCW